MNKIAAFAILISSILTAGARNIGSSAILHADPAPAQSALVVTMAADSDSSAEEDEVARQLTEYASTLLGRKYVWGATGPKSFDCSGFTSYVFRNSAGIELPRTSRMQFTRGTKVDRSDLQAGDLMFFSSPRTSKGVVGHVGIVTGVNDDGSVTFIHASTKKGITYQKFPDGGYFSRAYIGAKRVLPNVNKV